MIAWKRCLSLLAAAAAVAMAAAPETRNVIILTADGLRWEDLFHGIDPLLMNAKEAGMEDAAALRKQLWREDPIERRAALMPYLWKTLAPKGILLGNLDKQSSVKVTNSYFVSYPGYSEILTGRAQDDAIRGNDAVQNPSETVLEFLRRKLSLGRDQVALFGSWDRFYEIGESRPGSIVINAGLHDPGAAAITPRMRELGEMQSHALMGDGSMRHDYFTFQLAFEYLKAAHPRVMHIALGETDDWAHEHNYGRTLAMIQEYDSALRQLCEFLESDPVYRGKTLLVLASDHGRGATLQDWDSHGSKVPAAVQIWMGFFGPGVPAVGEASDTPPSFQRDIAPTILDQFGIDSREYQGVQGLPLHFSSPRSASAVRMGQLSRCPPHYQMRSGALHQEFGGWRGECIDSRRRKEVNFRYCTRLHSGDLKV